jgi:predicted DNA-binding transcriptional regulator YafY
MATDKITPFQRQLNLTMALLSAGKHGLSSDQILRTVPGYQTSKGEESADKLLTRDKEDLRRVGIRLVGANSNASESSSNYRYVIAEGSFAWPKDFKPTATQTRLLELAANCWHDNASQHLEIALTRLIALGEAPNRGALNELVPSFRPFDASFQSLAEAIEKQNVVEFKYRKPSTNEIETRTFAPWRFMNIEGEWLVQGWCYDRQDTRNFLLKRIVDKNIKALVSRVGKAKENTDADEFTRPEEENPMDAKPGKPAAAKPVTDAVDKRTYVVPTAKLLSAADSDLEEFRARNVASVKVKPGTAAWSHFEMDFEAGDTKELRYLDPELLAVQLRRYAGQIDVLAPEALVAEVRAGLEKVASAHA